MPDRFKGSRWKTERAKEHVADFDARAKAVLAQHAYEVVRHEDPDSGDLVFRVGIENDAPDEFLRLSPIVGDVLHNLRSALDLLVWSLVERNGGIPGVNTCFPIARSAKKYESVKRRCIAGVSKNAEYLIDRERPYKGGNDTLWHLHTLNVADKHRLLVTLGSGYTTRVALVVIEVTLPFVLEPDPRVVPLKDQAEIHRIPHHLREAMEKQPDPQFSFDVAFGQDEVVQGEPVVPTLNEFVSVTELIIERFAAR